MKAKVRFYCCVCGCTVILDNPVPGILTVYACLSESVCVGSFGKCEIENEVGKVCLGVCVGNDLAIM